MLLQIGNAVYHAINGGMYLRPASFCELVKSWLLEFYHYRSLVFKISFCCVLRAGHANATACASAPLLWGWTWGRCLGNPDVGLFKCTETTRKLSQICTANCVTRGAKLCNCSVLCALGAEQRLLGFCGHENLRWFAQGVPRTLLLGAGTAPKKANKKRSNGTWSSVLCHHCIPNMRIL